MSEQTMIEVENLTKYFGDFPAIEDISFQIRKGQIVGFLGPNGAGKSTTMRILTGFMPPTSGTAHIGGFDVVSESLEARRKVGYLPETVPLYTDMTVRDYLSYMGALRGMKKGTLRRRIGEVVDICHLEEYYNALIGKLSKGFRQRVGIAQAILHEPEVLVLDEPTIGIDPNQVVETRQLIKGLGGDRTIILSTHILPEVSMLCEEVIIIDEGQILAVDRPENLSQRLQGTERIELEVRGPAPQVMAALRQLPGVQDVTRTDLDDHRSAYVISSRRGADVRQQVARTVVENRWDLLSLSSASMSLEEIFQRLTTQEELE